MMDDFDWSGEDVAIEWQGAIAVYENESGGVVIRQQGDDGKGDQFVIVRPQNIDALIAALRPWSMP